jgi:hypothetical protein
MSFGWMNVVWRWCRVEASGFFEDGNVALAQTNKQIKASTEEFKYEGPALEEWLQLYFLIKRENKRCS